MPRKKIKQYFANKYTSYYFDSKSFIKVIIRKLIYKKLNQLENVNILTN